jgi:hypothetical protein
VTRKPDKIRNVEASVRQRLFNLSKEQARDFQSVLKLYFLERFLYRLSISRYRDSFLLKGALLFFARAEPEARPFTRPTKDIDLEALAMEPDLDGLRGIFAVVAAIAAPEDGVRFDPESVTVESIREDDRYGGIRVHLDAYLGQARDRIQIDVGFGDAVTPGPVALTYPTFLPALPAPDLAVYPIQTVVAEKWEATISLGETNSRLKDVIDLDELAGSESFDGAILQQAIRRTFERRQTPLDPKASALGAPYRSDPDRQTLWAAARKRYERDSAPERFENAMTRVIAFVGPPYLDAASGRSFVARWEPARREWIR